MRFRILSVASVELDNAWAFYESRARGLGAELIQAFSIGIDHIRSHPEAWHPLGNGVRRYRLTRFPYGIFYVVEPEEIVIVAFFHLHRKPEHWRDRLRND